MEYVAKNEVKPHRNEFKEIIDEIRENIKDKGITFTYVLTGSAKRNLVLRPSNSNKGFDCDYKIVIQKNEENLRPKRVKLLFMEEFDKVVVKRGYKNCEDSTQSISIKKIDESKSKQLNSYDVIITKIDENGHHILRNDKKGNECNYHYVQMADTSKFHENYRQIKGSDKWTELREQYKQRRESEEDFSNRRKAFQVLSDVVNNILMNST